VPCAYAKFGKNAEKRIEAVAIEEYHAKLAFMAANCRR
jgi:hypothetical protein